MAGTLQDAAQKVQEMERGACFLFRIEREVDDPRSQLDSLARRAETRLVFLGSVSRKGATFIKAKVANSP